MIDIYSFVLDRWKLGRRVRKSSSDWWSGNAVCCHHRGERPDTRSRGGVLVDSSGIKYSCFNCGFKTAFSIGSSFSGNFKKFMGWIGIDSQTIDMLTLEALRQKSIEGFIQHKSEEAKLPTFDSKELPENSELLNKDNPNHREYVDYLENRGINVEQYPYMISPSADGRDSNRIIIPFTHDSKIVGHTSRYLDDKIPKYVSELQHGYVFGIDIQSPSWQFAIVTEGILDALSIRGLALLHNTFNPEQERLLKSLNREIIIVPDFDKSGLKIIDDALRAGFSVSLPPWPDKVKDVNDAVRVLGIIGTIILILENKTNSKIKLEMRKRKILKEIKLEKDNGG